MPTHQVLTPSQREGLLSLPDDLPQEAIERLFTLTAEELAEVRRRRRPQNRLGYAVQWAYLRYPGRPWEPDEEPPAAVLDYLAQQLGVAPDEFARYGQERPITRHEHLRLLLQTGGYRPFEARVRRELAAWLRAAAPSTERGLKLVEALVQEMRTRRIVLPALSTLEALVWEVRRDARADAERTLVEGLSAAQAAALEALLSPDPEGEASLAALSWVRQVSGKPGPTTLLRFAERLRYLQGLGLPAELRQRVPPARLRALAREGRRQTPGHLARLRPVRRLAVLAAFAVETIADYTDEILLLHDRLIGGLLRRAGRRHEAAFYRSGRAINTKLRLLTQVGRAVLAARAAGQDLAGAIEAVTDWETLAAQLDEAETLTRPETFDILDEADQYYPGIRRYAAVMLEIIDFRSTPASEPVLAALTILRRLYAAEIRKVPVGAPVSFVRERWEPYVFGEDGIDRRYYELCVLWELRGGLRSGDIWVAASRGYRDFEAHLLPRETAAAAVAMLPVEREVKTYLDRRRVELATSLTRVEHQLHGGALEGVRVKRGRLIVSPLASAAPPAVDEQTQRAYELLPPIRITELLVEVDQWTGFTQQLTTVRGGTPCTDREALLSAILAEGTNLGPAKMAEATPGVNYGRLARAADGHLREETYQAALAELVNAQHRQALARLWGDGTTSSSDGQRFPVGGRREPSAQVNARYGTGPSIIFYTHLSDRYAPFHTKVIAAGVRDATHVLDGLLEHEAELSPAEHYTDTAGYTEQVFGLCSLLGFRFAPRMRGLTDKKLFTFEPVEAASPLAKLVGGRAGTAVIENNWDEVLRLAVSIQQGTVSSSMMLSKLAAYPRQNQLAWALRELGRIERTLFTLEWLESPELRRRVNEGLNKGEERNALARAVFFHRRGMVQEPRTAAMGNRACGLNLVVAAITLWNTVHLERALNQLEDRRAPLPAECLPHLSPLAWDHILLTGEYRWPTLG